MNVVDSKLQDFDGWILLAREAEPLFGPMADDTGFQEALKQAIAGQTAFCLRSAGRDGSPVIEGGIVISPVSNEIAWLVVSADSRRKGYGRMLLEYAIDRLDSLRSIRVQTFDASVPEGKAARKLYMDLGFMDSEDGGTNPAGIPTVIMERGPVREEKRS